jgi:hypothetical protein
MSSVPPPPPPKPQKKGVQVTLSKGFFTKNAQPGAPALGARVPTPTPSRGPGRPPKNKRARIDGEVDENAETTPDVTAADVAEALPEAEQVPGPVANPTTPSQETTSTAPSVAKPAAAKLSQKKVYSHSWVGKVRSIT